MIDSVLMRWAVKRYARFYWFVLLFLLAGLAAALILMAPQAVIQAEKHPFFLFGIVMSLAWGAGIFTREYRQGNLLEFLIALPVSRDRFFNTMLLAGAAPPAIINVYPLCICYYSFPLV